MQNLQKRVREAEAKVKELTGNAQNFQTLAAEHATTLEKLDDVSMRLARAEEDMRVHRHARNDTEKQLRAQVASLEERISNAELVAKQNALARSGAADELERRCKEMERRDQLAKDNVDAMRALEDMVKALRYENEAAETRALQEVAARQAVESQVISLRKASEKEISDLIKDLDSARADEIQRKDEVERLKEENEKITASLNELRNGSSLVQELEIEVAATRKALELEKQGREDDRERSTQQLAGVKEELAERDTRLAVLEDRLVESSRASSTNAEEVARMLVSLFPFRYLCVSLVLMLCVLRFTTTQAR